MQKNIIYMEFDGILGRIANSSGGREKSTPSIIRGIEVTLAIRPFKSGGGSSYVASDFQDIVSWDFVVAHDFVLTTSPQIRSYGAFPVIDVVDGIYSGAEIQIPLSDTNTEELVNALNGQPSVTLGTELCGFMAGNTNPVLVIQSQIAFYNRRSDAGTGIPVPVEDGQYNAAQINSLLAAKLNADFSTLETVAAITDGDMFAADDDSTGNPIVVTALKIWNYIKSKADAVYAAVSHSHAIADVTSLTDALNGKAAVSHVANTSNPHTVTAAQVGLGSVNNTSDADKPISTAQQEALDLKADADDIPSDLSDLTDALGLVASGYSAGGRLTLTSGDPAGNTAVTSGATLYYTPYTGNWLALYNGTVWRLYPFAELSLNLSATAANTIFDIFAYVSEGAPVLEYLSWASATARATALVRQNGILVKSGDATRRYLGTIRTTATAGTCADTENRRFVWNYYNQLDSTGRTYNTNTSWTTTATSNQECNGGTGQVRFECVLGMPGLIQMSGFGPLGSGSSTTTKMYMSAAKDSTTTGDATAVYFASNVISSITLSGWNPATDIGYHYVTMVEFVSSGTTGTGYGGTKYSVGLTVKK